RRYLHARIGEAIEALCADRLDEQAPILAYHYTEAGLKQQAIRYWERAGQRAIQRSANIEATAYLIKGLDVLMSLPETAERAQRELTLQMGLATSLVATKGLSAPEPEKAYARARELCQQVGEAAHLFPVLWGLSAAYVQQGKLRMARELGDQCLTSA